MNFKENEPQLPGNCIGIAEVYKIPITNWEIKNIIQFEVMKLETLLM